MSNSIAQNLIKFATDKTNIQTALVNKGVTAASTHGFDDFATDIASIHDNLIEKSISVNGTYDPTDDNVDGYSSVSVNVPNTYTQADEGKVVSNGALISQTAYSTTITESGTYDTTLNNSVTVESGVSSDVFLEIINATTPIATLDTYPYRYQLNDIKSSDYIHSTADTSYVYKLGLLKNLYVNTSWLIDNGTSSSYTTISKMTMCLILYENGTEISRSTKDVIKSMVNIQTYRPSIKFPISDFASFYSEHPNGIFKVAISATQTSSPTIRAQLTAITITDA